MAHSRAGARACRSQRSPATLERFAGKPVRVRGEIASVCQKRGCWMRLRDGAHEARICFRDYAFFVPLDIAGRTAVVEGVATVTVTTEAMRRHYAEDAGKSPAEVAAIVGDETSLQVMADAVEVLGRPDAAGQCADATFV